MTWAAVRRLGSGVAGWPRPPPAGAGIGIVGVELGADLGVVPALRRRVEIYRNGGRFAHQHDLAFDLGLVGLQPLGQFFPGGPLRLRRGDGNRRRERRGPRPAALAAASLRRRLAATVPLVDGVQPSTSNVRVSWTGATR